MSRSFWTAHNGPDVGAVRLIFQAVSPTVGTKEEPQKNFEHETDELQNLEGNAPQVLIVEDGLLTAEQLRNQIERVWPEAHISAVTTENDAVACIEEHDFEVILLDLRLAQGNGFGVLKSINAKRPCPNTIVLTNFSLPQYKEFALLLGAHYFLDKSTDIELLSDILQTIKIKWSSTRPGE